MAGTTLYLPIHVDDALFSVGDGHGVQGDGEVCVTAIETGLIGTFELIVREDMHLEWPRAETPTHVMTMAFDPDLDDCVVIALRQMVDLVAKEAGINAPGGLRALQPRRRRARHPGRQRLQGRPRHAREALPGARRAISAALWPPSAIAAVLRQAQDEVEFVAAESKDTPAPQW